MNKDDWIQTTKGWQCKWCGAPEGMQHRSDCPVAPVSRETSVASCRECGARADAPHQPTCPTTEATHQCKQCGRVRSTWGACSWANCQHREPERIDQHDNDPGTEWTEDELVVPELGTARCEYCGVLPEHLHRKECPKGPGVWFGTGVYPRPIEEAMVPDEATVRQRALLDHMLEKTRAVVDDAAELTESAMDAAFKDAVVHGQGIVHTHVSRADVEPLHCPHCGTPEGSYHGAGCPAMEPVPDATERVSLLREQATPYDAKPDRFEGLSGALVDLARDVCNTEHPMPSQMQDLLAGLVLRVSELREAQGIERDRLDGLENAMGNLELGDEDTHCPDCGAAEGEFHDSKCLSLLTDEHRQPLPDRGERSTLEQDRHRMVKAIGMLTELLNRTLPLPDRGPIYSEVVHGGAHPLDMDSPPDLRAIIEEQGKDLGKAKDTIERLEEELNEAYAPEPDPDLALAHKAFDVQREQLYELTQERNELRKFETDARDTIQGLRKQVSDLTARCDKATALHSELRTQLAASEATATSAPETWGDIAGLRAKVDRLERELRDRDNKLVHGIQQEQMLQDEIKRLQHDLRDKDASMATVSTDLANLKMELSDTQAALAKSERNRESLKHELRMLKGDQSRLLGG